MFDDTREATYYRRRAASQTAAAAATNDTKVADLHRELATLYEARAQSHERAATERSEGAGG